MDGALAPFVTEYGPDHTAVRASDVLAPVGGARTVRTYGDAERPAAVALGLWLVPAALIVLFVGPAMSSQT